MEAKIASVAFNNYGQPSLSVSVIADGNYSTFQIKDDDLLAIQAALWVIINRKKQEMAQAISNMQTPLAIEAPSTGKVIDDDWIPF